MTPAMSAALVDQCGKFVHLELHDLLAAPVETVGQRLDDLHAGVGPRQA
jgi:hypothetical protein